MWRGSELIHVKLEGDDGLLYYDDGDDDEIAIVYGP